MPTSYTIALFLHVCGALGLTIGFCTGFYSLVALRRADDVGQVQIIGRLMSLIDPLTIVSGLLALVTGIFLTAQGWSFTAGWIDVALGSYVLLAAINGVVVQRQRSSIVAMARQSPAGPVPAEITQRIHQPLLSIGSATQFSLIIAIVFLMTTKPSLLIALSTVALALVVGGGGGLLWRRPTPSATMAVGR